VSDADTFTLTVHRYDAPAGAVSVRRKRQAVVDWYIHRADAEFRDRLTAFEPSVGVDDVPVEVRDLPDRWGEYDAGTIRLNWRLVLAPVRIVDYVIAHELVHATHERHTDAFWNALGALVPDYEERRDWLRVHGRTLSV
jgi:hypothetical protein